MSNYLYNGVELPGLPGTWNETEHPHLFIRVVSIDGSAENAVYSLFAASAAAVSYDDNGILFPLSAVGEKYAVSEGAWVESSESLSDSFYIKRNDGFIYTLWANFDILNSDGSVYIAASEPVPVVGKFPLREWLGWLIAGLCSRPLPMSKREPVAWLYNGVRLPGLPEWDKSKYPYAVIDGGMYPMLKRATLYLFSSLEYTTDESNGSRGIILTESNHIRYSGSATGTEWAETTPGTGYLNIENIRWANTDIIDADGSVYLSASAPIPVYE